MVETRPSSTSSTTAQGKCCLLQGKWFQNHPCHCGGWVKGVLHKRSLNNFYTLVKAPHKDKLALEKAMIHRAISGSFHIWCHSNCLHSVSSHCICCFLTFQSFSTKYNFWRLFILGGPTCTLHIYPSEYLAVLGPPPPICHL